jgi:hypothetical protein
MWPAYGFIIFGGCNAFSKDFSLGVNGAPVRAGGSEKMAGQWDSRICGKEVRFPMMLLK